MSGEMDSTMGICIPVTFVDIYMPSTTCTGIALTCVGMRGPHSAAMISLSDGMYTCMNPSFCLHSLIPSLICTFHVRDNIFNLPVQYPYVAGIPMSHVHDITRYGHTDYCVLCVPPDLCSYKPQKISPKFEGSVRTLLHKKIRESYLHPQFQADVMKPLNIEALMDQDVQNLSGGELQRVAITLCLGQPADIYLIDEPSAYLDSEQRIMASKVRLRSLTRTIAFFYSPWYDGVLLFSMVDDDFVRGTSVGSGQRVVACAVSVGFGVSYLNCLSVPYFNSQFGSVCKHTRSCSMGMHHDLA